AAPQSHPRRLCPEPVDFMLLAMATASGNLHALPPVTRVLPQGELLHRALLSRAGEGDRRSPSVLSGRDEDGRPLRGERGHRHAHLPRLELAGGGRLEHVLIWAPMGLDAEAQRAVRAARKTFSKNMKEPLRLALEAAGSRQDLSSIPSPWGERLGRLFGDLRS